METLKTQGDEIQAFLLGLSPTLRLDSSLPTLRAFLHFLIAFQLLLNIFQGDVFIIEELLLQLMCLLVLIANSKSSAEFSKPSQPLGNLFGPHVHDFPFLGPRAFLKMYAKAIDWLGQLLNVCHFRKVSIAIRSLPKGARTHSVRKAHVSLAHEMLTHASAHHLNACANTSQNIVYIN